MNMINLSLFTKITKTLWKNDFFGIFREIKTHHILIRSTVVDSWNC